MHVALYNETICAVIRGFGVQELIILQAELTFHHLSLFLSC